MGEKSIFELSLRWRERKKYSPETISDSLHYFSKRVILIHAKQILAWFSAVNMLSVCEKKYVMFKEICKFIRNYTFLTSISLNYKYIFFPVIRYYGPQAYIKHSKQCHYRVFGKCPAKFQKKI